jgi:hypothetical protein
MGEKQNEQRRMTPVRYKFSGPAASPLYEIPMQVKQDPATRHLRSLGWRCCDILTRMHQE